MKKILSVLLCFMLLFSTLLSVSADDSGEIDFGEIVCLQLGDINADTQVNATDMSQLRKILLSLSEAFNKATADLNYDNEVDTRDLVRFKKKLAGVTVSHFNKEANSLKVSILKAKDVIPEYTGKIIYIAENGIAGYIANSINNPSSFSELSNWNNSSSYLKSGDVVLFKRGDVFRGEFLAKSGVYYGAYGEGEKPKIYGSRVDYSNVDWALEDNGLYTYTFSYDVGNIFLNNDEITGVKKDSLEDIINTYDFYCEKTDDNYKLYLKLDKAPSQYENIEIGVGRHIIHITEGVSDVKIENLCIKYSGAHGIYAYNNNSNITVKNCEISHIGGSYIGSTTNPTLRFGNAVEFWAACSNIRVENNWIHDIYDSGITHQGDGSYTAENITFHENLIERCGLASIEYWLWYNEENGDSNSASNVTYSNNIMRFAGFGFGGEQRADKNATAHIQSGITNHNDISNFTISGNIFDQSVNNLINIGSRKNVYPVFNNNIYAQTTNAYFGTYRGIVAAKYDVFIDDTVSKYIENDANIYWY